jgi:hypothetical protein
MTAAKEERKSIDPSVHLRIILLATALVVVQSFSTAAIKALGVPI